MKKRLLMLQPNAHRVYWGWYKYLAKKYDFYLIVPNTGDVPFLGKRCICLPRKYAFLKPPFSHFIFMKGLKRKIQEIKPDIIVSKVANEPYTQTAFCHAKRNGIPFFIVEEQKNQPLGWLKRMLFAPYWQLLIKRYKKTPFISVTKQSHEFVERNGFQSTYVPVSYWKENPPRQKHPQDCLRMLFVGRFVKVKYVDFFIRTLGELVKEKRLSTKDFHFIVVGYGSEEQSLRSLTAKYELETVIEFTGRVPNEKIGVFFNRSNLFILPSYEALGLVVLEAFYYGLPVLCSDAAGASSYIAPGKNGETFSFMDADDLKEKLLLFCSKTKREAMGDGVQKLRKNYLLTENGKVLEKAIRSLHE